MRKRSRISGVGRETAKRWCYPIVSILRNLVFGPQKGVRFSRKVCLNEERAKVNHFRDLWFREFRDSGFRDFGAYLNMWIPVAVQA